MRVKCGRSGNDGRDGRDEKNIVVRVMSVFDARSRDGEG
jgi:hypothetical protein